MGVGGSDLCRDGTEKCVAGLTPLGSSLGPAAATRRWERVSVRDTTTGALLEDAGVPGNMPGAGHVTGRPDTGWGQMDAPLPTQGEV